MPTSNFLDNKFMVIDGTDKGVFRIPLVLTDIVEAALPRGQLEKQGAAYVVALAACSGGGRLCATGQPTLFASAFESWIRAFGPTSAGCVGFHGGRRVSGSQTFFV